MKILFHYQNLIKKGNKMLRRLKRGEYKAMSLEERRKWKHMLQKKWRKNHPEWVKKSNHEWALYYVQYKPFVCMCDFCGKEFNAARKYYKKCPDCIEKKRQESKERKLQKEQLRLEKQKRNKKIIELHKKGWLQSDISAAVGLTQAGVSALLRRNNFRSQKYHIRVDKKKNKK